MLYKDELKKYNGITISYNSARYPTSYGNNISFTWDNFFHLSSYTKDNDTTSYTYNYQGIRTKKTLPEGTIREYILEGKRIVAEKITSNNTSTYITYLYGQDGILGMYYNNSFYYFRKNILGDIIEIYSGETLIARYQYTAYGETRVFNGSGVDITNDSTQINHIGRINPFRYRGYYYDEESGMYYCNARYYVPEWCRWLSKDESEYLNPNTIDGLNLYAYCLNNPIMYRDENGTFWTALLALFAIGIIGAATSFVINTVVDAMTGQGFDWARGGIAAFSGFVGALLLFIPGGDFLSPFLSSGINTLLQMMYSGYNYEIYQYIFRPLIVGALSGATSLLFSKILNSFSCFADYEFFLKNYIKFASNYGGIQLSFAPIANLTGYIVTRKLFYDFFESLFNMPLEFIGNELLDMERRNNE